MILRAEPGTLLALVAWSTLSVGCTVGASTRAEGPLQVKYQLERRGRGHAVAATFMYRNLLALSLFSRCKMVPTDSQAFDLRAQSCGAPRAAVLGLARLFLERAATTEFIRPVRLENRLRWVDLPREGSCWP